MDGKGVRRAYDEINPVAAIEGEVGGYISTGFVVFRDAKVHGEDETRTVFQRVKDEDEDEVW